MEGQGLPQAIIRPRGYQLEMLDESIRQNVIVAMDTGSGKTQIAVLRIKAELERCPPSQIVWFLAPTVVLATQQYEVFCSQLPSYQSRVLTGTDGVDRWGEQRIWDAILENVRIVVSTHQVLLDALTHGFIRIERICLLVFDEAHCCTHKHPASLIMKHFYHPRVSRGEKVPYILGLTASPVINAKAGELQKLEESLDATAKTPRQNRQELLKYVYPPVLSKVSFRTDTADHSFVLGQLIQVFQNLEISEDPYVKLLLKGRDEKSVKLLSKALNTRKTFCQDSFKRLCQRSIHIHEELGRWTSDCFIKSCIEQFQKCNGGASDPLIDWDHREKSYLLRKLNSIPISSVNEKFDETDISLIAPKAESLIDLLVREHKSSFTGIIFVKQRATVAMLAKLLSVHPQTKDRFSIRTFIGNQSRKPDIFELLAIKDQNDALDDLRTGKANLVISTSVLEEGIDISACNIVICFELPPHLKSFIQRRGRARKEESKYILMLPEDDMFVRVEKWEELEEQMKVIYMNERRKFEKLRELEAMDEDCKQVLSIEKTGAILTFDNVISHLNHFCATLPGDAYMDRRPEYEFRGFESGKFISAKVTLPSAVDSALREHCGTSKWRTEKTAARDAAFQAYLALYKAGLVNDNMLPLSEPALKFSESQVEKRAAIVEVNCPLNPWVELIQQWNSHETFCAITIDTGGFLPKMVMLLPGRVPILPPLTVHWDTTKKFNVSFLEVGDCQQYSSHFEVATLITQTLLLSFFRAKLLDSKLDFLALFIPATDIEYLESWHRSVEGKISGREALAMSHGVGSFPYGLLRDLTSGLTSPGYIHKNVALKLPKSSRNPKKLSEESGEISPVDPQEELCFEALRYPKRMDFLHEIPSSNIDSKNPNVDLAVANCVFEKLPLPYVQFTTLIPSIIHHIETHLIAWILTESLLAPVGISNLNLVKIAISPSAVREPLGNYQRLEFFGDSMLKYFTTVTILAQHLTWHEGYLSACKDRIVGNAPLCNAALQINLPRFILAKPFTGSKWQPPYKSDLLNPAQATREMSTKTLADVMESLIGASFLDGMEEKCLRCLRVLIPRVPWLATKDSVSKLNDCVPINMGFSQFLGPLERLIGYQFKKKTLLVEALTHPSHSGSFTTANYQRYEFLGDAVLDCIVVNKIFRHEKMFPHPEMHTLREVVVNADFLAFLCLELSVMEKRTELDKTKITPTLIDSAQSFHIWEFMRHTNPELPLVQKEVMNRHKELRESILEALEKGDKYPWALLLRAKYNKFFSDLIESITGAVFIDSGGSTEACEGFLEKLGVLKYLHRAMEGGVRIKHPKEQLGILANDQRVRYKHGKEQRKDRGERLWCKVYVGDRELVSVGDGVSPEEVMTRAADEAIDILMTERGTSKEDEMME
ncbi:MAG: Dicer-like protein 2 [Cirrosporium novae-zelandiae]|nr:MAG: Dicer-like protein 2 [Cirrosporium novae-zelandiae]